VDAKTFKKQAQKQKSVPKLKQPLNDDKERNTIRNQHVKDKDNKTNNSSPKENKENKEKETRKLKREPYVKRTQRQKEKDTSDVKKEKNEN
jgi:hypothetical protein